MGSVVITTHTETILYVSLNEEVKTMFEMPKVTVIKFAVEDVVTTSINVDLPEEEL